MNEPIVHPAAHERFDSAAADRSLVRTALDDAPVLVAVHGGVLVGHAPIVREAAIVVDDGNVALRVQAADDRKWRGAVAGVLTEEHDVALLGPATWLAPESVDALARLFTERAPACIAEFTEGAEVTLHTPTPSGTWVRLPGIVTGPLNIRIAAVPINADAATVVAAHWVGLPAFTDAGLAGFLIHDANGHIMVRHVDHLIRLGVRTTAERLEKSPQAPKRLKTPSPSAQSSHLCTGVSTAETVAHDFMTIAEAAVEARVSPKRMRALIAAGVLREGEHYTRPAGLRPRTIREGLLEWLCGHVPSAPAQSSRRPPGRSKLNPALIRPARKPPRE